ncbi:hypothetical protein ACGYK1_12365 [Sulfitobacter sp. 1A13191]|uniref:hypothetical protein n=1 Tax=unclassified Sulfitobacter TaxID=196795 RepID=UPI003745DE65
MTLRQKLEALAYRSSPPVVAAAFALQRLDELGLDGYPEIGLDSELMKRLIPILEFLPEEQSEQ